MIEYEQSQWLWKIIFRRQGSVVPFAFLSAFLPAVASSLIAHWDEGSTDIRYKLGFSDAMTSTVFWTAYSAPLFLMLGYRTSQALSRFWEGTSLLHAMRGEWFDSASCLATFSTTMLKEKPEQVKVFRHTLMRLMSLCHGSALDEIRAQETESYEVLDHQGLDRKTMEILRECKTHGFNRVEVILHMIQVLVINALNDKILDVPPPILSRVYQTLSRGFVHLLSAKKVRDTRFPFPYAQLIAVMLWGLVIITPICMATFLPHEGWCAIATFLPIFGTFALNMVAEELEMPYGEDANDLPLDHFQREMNSSLLMLSHDSSDHVASVGHKAHMAYEELSHSLMTYREGADLNSAGDESFPTTSVQHSVLQSVRASLSIKKGASTLSINGATRKNKSRNKTSLYAMTSSVLDAEAGSQSSPPTFAGGSGSSFDQDAAPSDGLQGSIVDCDSVLQARATSSASLSVVQEEKINPKDRNPFQNDFDKEDKQQESEQNRWQGAPSTGAGSGAIESTGATTTGETGGSGNPPIMPTAMQNIVDQLTSLAPASARTARGSPRSSNGRPNSSRRSNPGTPRTKSVPPAGMADVRGTDITSSQVGTVKAQSGTRSAWRQSSRTFEVNAGRSPEEVPIRAVDPTAATFSQI